MLSTGDGMKRINAPSSHVAIGSYDCGSVGVVESITVVLNSFFCTDLTASYLSQIEL